MLDSLPTRIVRGLKEISEGISLAVQEAGYLDGWDDETCSQFCRQCRALFFTILRGLEGLTGAGCYDIKEGGPQGYTPLALAAYNRHDESS